MSKLWHWEQGRLGRYLNFDTIREIAKVLDAKDGLLMPRNKPGAKRRPDPLRSPFRKAGIQFFPVSGKSYDVWRNHRGLFGLLLLGIKVGDKLRVTDICRAVARTRQPLTQEQYFTLLIQRSYSMPPASTQYDPHARVVFPMCAIMRFLIARGPATKPDILKFVVRNACIGNESIASYGTLKPGHRRADIYESRATGEILGVLCASGFVVGDHQRYSINPMYSASVLAKIATPSIVARLDDHTKETLQLGSLGARQVIPSPKVLQKRIIPNMLLPWNTNSGIPLDADTIDFAEGGKNFTQHLKTERSNKLRNAFVRKYGTPKYCDICEVSPLESYPWLSERTNGNGERGVYLHLHHKLPLSSSAATGFNNITALVALCGLCHMAIHVYYRLWLSEHDRKDFRNRKEAESAYRKGRLLYRRYNNIK